MTLIGNGVTILPEYQIIPGWETVGWQDKKEIFNLLKRHELSNVLLLSGDVHFAQVYENKCISLSGQRLVEVTSSGLSHTLDDIWSSFKAEPFETYPSPFGMVNAVTPSFFTLSDPYFDLNFGNIVISADSSVKIEIRNDKNQILFE